MNSDGNVRTLNFLLLAISCTQLVDTSTLRRLQSGSITPITVALIKLIDFIDLPLLMSCRRRVCLDVAIKARKLKVNALRALFFD